MSKTSAGSGRLSVASSISGVQDIDNQATEELTGIQWDEGMGETQEFAGTDALSEIGGVVSQAEANMDFSTNLEAAMEGVQKRQNEAEKARGEYANFDDTSLSRFADSYWRVSDEGSELGLEAMELSTQTAETTNGNRERANGPSRSRLGLPGRRGSTVLDTNDDSFMARASDALRAGSRASSNSRRTANARRGSQNSVRSYREEPEISPARVNGIINNDKEEEEEDDDDDDDEHQQLPTFSSPKQKAMAVRAPPGFNMAASTMSLDLTRPPFLAADSGSTVNDGAENRYARLVARYSGVPMQRLQPSATGRIIADHLADDLSSEALSLDALPDTPGINATAGFSSDQMSLASSPGIDRGGINDVARHAAAFSPRRDHQHREAPRFGATPSYYEAADNESFESLEHPNMGSQGSPPQPLQTMRISRAFDDQAYYDREQRDAFDMDGLSDDDTDEFGDGRINSLGGSGPLRIDGAFRHIADADDMFGDRCTTSDPSMSSIMRDHERVFSDLFDSDGPTEDLDAMQPPDSLFASSTSIVAELSRRRQERQRQQQQPEQPQQNNHRISTWDGREATADALLLQEAQFSSVHRNPIEMLEKTNSLGMATEDDSDISGLFPESAISPQSAGGATRQQQHQEQRQAMIEGDGVSASRVPPPRIRSNTGMAPHMGLLRQRRQREQMQIATGVVGGMPTTPQSAPLGGPYVHEAPPPTTPTTFIMRDTQHRPASRVLRQVSPLDGDYSSDEPSAARQANRGLGLLPHAHGKRPAGPRRAPFDSTHKQRIPSTASDATSSAGLGSLLHDASMAPAELTRTSFAMTPRHVPLGRRINSGSPQSAASNNTTAHYLPFQEPTVDVSRLPDYRDVGVGRIEPGSSQRRRAASRNQAGPFAPHASVHSSHSPSVGSDPTTATHEVVQNGPSLRDIYDLLQRTVSTVEPPAHQQEQQEEGEKHSSYDHMVPPLLQSSFVDARPSAPTPRRSRRNPWHSSDESDDNGPAADQSRMRTYLHRFASEPAGFGTADYEPTRENMGNTPPTAAAAAAAATVIPSPLAEKLVELAALLAKNSRSKSPTTRSASHPRDADDDKKNELLRRELLLLQRQILSRFDEYHAEIDMLRAEVRHASTAPSTAAHRMSLVAAAAAADDQQQRMRDADDVFSAASDSRSPPMMQMPLTAKNKQRHMVQWLSSQQQGGSPGMRRTTVEDIDDAAGEEAEQGYQPSRACVYGGSNDNQEEEDALSDASTTVPDPVDQHRRMSMRAPIGPYIGGVAPVTPKRAEQRDMLEMRELLHSVRRSSIHRHRKKQHSANDDDGKMLYSRHLAQQLADTLAELQRVHVRHFHGNSKEEKESKRHSCAVCAALDAQNHDPYLYGRNAVAYRSMTTRQLQGLLNAYVAAMEDEFGDASSFEDPVVRLSSSKPVRHAFTPSRSSNLKPRQTNSTPEEHSSSATTRVVIGLLREELDALSRRYHRLVDEFHALNPSNADHQRRRRTMTRELKDLVDMLDVKGEQIAMLSALHPADAAITPSSKASGAEHLDAVASMKTKKGVSSVRLSAERAYQSARALQQALGELY